MSLMLCTWPGAPTFGGFRRALFKRTYDWQT
jgi:hypothetical protein